MNYIKKYAIKIDNLTLFYCKGGWKASPDDATKFDSVDEAKTVAIKLNKPGLVIVEMKVPKSTDNW
jgi:hypothetical protein